MRPWNIQISVFESYFDSLVLCYHIFLLTESILMINVCLYIFKVFYNHNHKVIP